MPDNCIDAVVTDPPYGLEFMGVAWDSFSTPKGKSRTPNTWEDHGSKEHARTAKALARIARNKNVAFQEFTGNWAAEIFRVLKPGGHLLSFGGTRTYHRMAVAIEDAGFEIRDQILWCYGSGMPKSLNFGCVCKQGKALPYSQGDGPTSDTQHDMRSLRSADLSQTVNPSKKSGQVLFAGVSQPSLQERGTARTESQVGGRKQSRLEGRLVHRTGKGLQDDSIAEAPTSTRQRVRSRAYRSSREEIGAQTETGRRDSSQESGSGRQSAQQYSGLSVAQRALDTQSPENGTLCPTCRRLQAFAGLGTSLKPATEPICLARKPLSESTVAKNVLRWGTGAINVDGCRIGYESTPNAASNPLYRVRNGYKTKVGSDANGSSFSLKPNGGNVTAHDLGRWPANLIHDGSAEVIELFPQQKSGANPTRRKSDKFRNTYGDFEGQNECVAHRGEDAGSASRFFYCAKASRKERGEGNNHPTVKPISLISYLIRLITPPNGVVLDPFMGSGTTALACIQEGVNFIGFEREKEYLEIAQKRIRHNAVAA